METKIETIAIEHARVAWEVSAPEHRHDLNGMDASAGAHDDMQEAAENGEPTQEDWKEFCRAFDAEIERRKAEVVSEMTLEELAWNISAYFSDELHAPDIETAAEYAHVLFLRLKRGAK